MGLSIFMRDLFSRIWPLAKFTKLNMAWIKVIYSVLTPGCLKQQQPQHSFEHNQCDESFTYLIWRTTVDISVSMPQGYTLQDAFVMLQLRLFLNEWENTQVTSISCTCWCHSRSQEKTKYTGYPIKNDTVTLSQTLCRKPCSLSSSEYMSDYVTEFKNLFLFSFKTNK